MKKLIIYIFFIINICLFSFCLKVQAAEDGYFSVQPILPKNQLKQGHSFFHLLVKKNDKQEIGIKIFNNSNEDATYRVSVNPVSTSSSGILLFGKNTAEYNIKNSPKLSINDIVSEPDQEIKIKAKSNKIVYLNLKIPIEGFEGLIAGGIEISRVSEELNKKEKKDNLSIKNEIRYQIGLFLQNEEKVSVEPELELLDVFINNINNQNTISTLIQNKKPVLMENMLYEATIINKKNNNIYAERVVRDYQLAPNSMFLFNIPISDEFFKKGTYELVLKASSYINNQEWKWVKQFNITEQQIKKLNGNEIEKSRNDNFIVIKTLIVIVMLIFCLIIGVSIYIGLQK